jgi:hypothetical protein
MYFMANTPFWQRDSGPRVLERAVWKGLILSDALFLSFPHSSTLSRCYASSLVYLREFAVASIAGRFGITKASSKASLFCRSNL